MMFDGSHGHLAAVRQAVAEQVSRLIDAAIERRTSKAWWGVTEVALDETEHTFRVDEQDLPPDHERILWQYLQGAAFAMQNVADKPPAGDVFTAHPTT